MSLQFRFQEDERGYGKRAENGYRIQPAKMPKGPPGDAKEDDRARKED
jgi:hypothetical protein